ncbi:MAG: nicotinate-nucleotide pyrophosphorylase [Proteobacteria bacterium]|nr:nicotinate-nucleotide pyrophosphorylase [Pseudomonadota bacterium]
MSPAPPPDLRRCVENALREDVGTRDLTAQLVPDEPSDASITCREEAVLCGRPYAEAVFRSLDSGVRLDWSAADGDRVPAGGLLCRLHGRARALLTGERSALNFLQTLSATATAASRYVEAVAGTGATILDTRKTLPGLRLAQKYAVRCGGARNHRLGLYDGILIKENHIAAAGSIRAAVEAARRLSSAAPVEVEVETLEELREALDARADIVMLDDFTLEAMREAVAMNRAHRSPAKLEASGGVDLTTVRTIAETGVDYISVGSITKHVRAIDLSMRFDG